VAQEPNNQKIAVEERLFSLVLALLATQIGLSKNDILSTVQGYRQSFVEGGNNDNLERKFERDKDDLRDLGIPVEAIDTPGEPGNNQNTRYRIPRSGYGFPAEIRFTPEEVSLLGLAAMVWREGSLSGESRRALLKIHSLGAEANEPVLGYSPRVSVRDTAFQPLNVALAKNAVVTFDYLKPGQSAARSRIVEPRALVQHQGRWYLYGKEPSADRSKTFLLRRIVSAVKQTGTVVEAPAGEQTVAALTELDALWRAQLAIVDAVAGSDAAQRLGKRKGTTQTASGSLALHYSDLNLVADELAACGPEVHVVSPPELRSAVLERLQLTVAHHG
jgi:proteasome accessory factor B